MSELGERIQLIFDTARLYEQKIKKLEQQKAELIESIHRIGVNCNYHLDCPIDEALKKYSGE